jgi:hypothetical protein
VADHPQDSGLTIDGNVGRFRLHVVVDGSAGYFYGGPTRDKHLDVPKERVGVDFDMCG